MNLINAAFDGLCQVYAKTIAREVISIIRHPIISLEQVDGFGEVEVV